MNIEKIASRHYWFFLLALMAITLGLSLHLGKVAPFSEKKLLFVPEAKFIERICGTFRNPVALMFYMKGAQELAYKQTQKTDLLFALFQLAIDLDPNLLQAAFLGGMVTPSKLRDLPRAIKLLEDARKKMPLEWKIPYWIGFNYLQIEEYEKAAEYYKKASELPDALPFLKTASVYILSQGSNLEMAVAEAERLLNSGDDEDTSELMLLRLSWLKTMQFLEESNREFKQKVGRYPQRLEELVEHNILKALPPDEFGEGFYLVHPGDFDLGYMVRSDF